MNQRIKELAEQAFYDTALYGGKPGDKDFDQRYNEKFAELIIKECAEIANQQFSAAAEMKKRFGVEE